MCGFFIFLCIFCYIALLRSNAKHKAYCEQADKESAIETEIYHQKIAEINRQITSF